MNSILKSPQLVSVSLIVLILAVSASHQVSINSPAAATDQFNAGAFGGLGNVASGLVGGVTNQLGLGHLGLGQMTNNLLQTPINLVGTVPGLINGALKPLTGVFGGTSTGALTSATKFNEASERPIQDGLGMGIGALDGFVTGAAAATGLTGVSRRIGSAALMAAENTGSGFRAGYAGSGLTGSSAAGDAAWGAAAAAGANSARNYAFGMGFGDGPFRRQATTEGLYAAAGAQATAASANNAAMEAAASQNARFAAEGAAAAQNARFAAEGAAAAQNARFAAAEGATAANLVDAPTAAYTNTIVSTNANKMLAANYAANRPALAADAFLNVQAESAIAGNDMVAHGANNARSASLAGNAYRQAKLVSARDRLNIAGTIQNSARISDAAIATHDAATKAEDSLLGSELAVDSAATVLDSDAAYIPPVTNSLLRSLPYGRLGLRNIVPKPLTYPSVLLPDVWLNGQPVNYLNVPFRMLPYGLAPTAATNPLQQSGRAFAGGYTANGQPFYSNNGLLINGMVVDPSVAYLANNMYGVVGSSILPTLANGQLEAQDEVAAAHWTMLQQQAGAGTTATYHGFNRLNPVPMLTGSVSDANLTPTTTIGTTYPIGSALVIEPRDSYFQDYVDNASSRQNFDEHQQ